MKQLTDAQATYLVDQALRRRLSPTEQAQLESYLQTKDGSSYARAHTHLLSHLRLEMEDDTLNQLQLKRLAKGIDAKVQARRKRRRVVQVTQSFALASAVILLMIITIPRLIRLQTPAPLEPTVAAVEELLLPTAEPSPTPAPTATLPTDSRMLDLRTAETNPLKSLTVNPYVNSIDKVEELAGFPLRLPTQAHKSFYFIGATYNDEMNSAEIVLSQKVGLEEPLWILSQKPTDEPLTEPLETIYQVGPEDWDDEDVWVYDLPTELVLIGDAPATYGGIEFYKTNHSAVTLIHTLTWHAAGVQFPLTVYAPLKIKPETMAAFVTNLNLQ